MRNNGDEARLERGEAWILPRLLARARFTVPVLAADRTEAAALAGGMMLNSVQVGVEPGLRFAVLFDRSGGCVQLDWAQIADWKPANGFLWIHLEREAPEAQAWVRDKSGIDPVSVEALLADESRPRVNDIADALLIVLRTTLAALSQLDPLLDDASMSLGATPAMTFRRVTLPLIGRGVGAGGFLAFMASFDNVPVSLFWHAGGHDGGNSDDSLIFQATVNWFDKYLKGKSITISPFQVTDSQGSLSVTDSTAIATELVGKRVPGSTGEKIQTLVMDRQFRPFFNPIGAAPAALTALPGLGVISNALNGIASSLGGGSNFGNLGDLGSITPSLLPGQSAQFESQPANAPFNIVGSPKISVKVTSTTSDATLFFSLLVKSQSGLRSTSSAVAPVKLENIPKDGADIQITLPAVFAKVSPGESLVVGVSATDQGFLMPIDGRLYTVAPLTDLSVPTMELTVKTSGKAQFVWPIGALISLIFALLFYFWRRPQRKALAIDHASDSNLEIGESGIKKNQTIIEISNLSKVYQDGYQAVADLSFKVGKGQVVGLLGPNGAGKTTTLRMLMGLIWPTAGEIKINGKAVYPGSPALAQLGSFVEGPGLLPHLTGRENLEIYWRAVGRTQDARLDEVIAITKLGSALDKKVRSYSQGMRQRIAIAQSMMGLPDVLILDEPTNGLDPQQIAEMRKVLKDYAKSGRTVVISSHLLAEVEQTCSHVVLMHRGKLIASGTMRNIIKDAKNLEEIFLELIGDDLIIGKGKQ